MANLLIENKKVVLTVVLRSYFDDVNLKDYLAENLPDAHCSFAIGYNGPNNYREEYTITIDAVQESVLLLTLRDFCQKNNLTHQIDVAD